MSISQLLVNNDLSIKCSDIDALKINGIQGQIIDPNVNTVGQVLKITSLNPKTAAFEDQEAGLPDTVGFPDGYVLKIIDNTTNVVNWEPDSGTGANLPPTSEQPAGYVLGILDPLLGTLEWKQDAGGSIPDPLVLSGFDSINKFQVRDAGNSPRFTIDTVDDKIKIQNAELQVQKNGFNIFTANDTNGVTVRNSALGVEYVNFFSDTEQVLIRGAVDRDKFRVVTNGNVPVLKVDTDGQSVSVGEFGGTNEVNKFRVIKSDGNNLLAVDTVNKEIKFNGTSPGKAELVFLDAPETLPVGVPSSVNMKMGYDEGGGGDTNFVGYIASNGPNSVYNVVNNEGSGLFFVAPNCGIQTTAVTTNIISQTANSTCDIQFEDNIRLKSNANSCSIDVGGNSEIEINSNNNLRLIGANSVCSIDVGLDNNITMQTNTAGGEISLITRKEVDLLTSKRAELVIKPGVSPALGVYEFTSFIDGGGPNQNNEITLTNNGTNAVWNSAKALSYRSEQSVTIGDDVFTPLVTINPTNVVAISSTLVDVNAVNILNLVAANDLNMTATVGPLDIKTDAGKLTLNSVDNNLDVLASNGLIRIISDEVIIQAASSFTLSGNVVIPTLSTLAIADAPIDPTEATNKAYVDDRVGGLSSGISDSATAIGSVVGDQLLNPLSFLPSSPTVPPNYLKAGQSYQLTMAGSAVYTNGDAFVISLKSGAVVLGSISIAVPSIAGGGQTWELEADFTIRSITLGIATIVCSFDFTYNDGQEFIGKRSITTSTTLDTTVANTLEAYVNFASGQVTDNITTNLFILKKVVDV